MTQLVYHPAFDAYHAFLRSVRILLACPDGLDPMALRILDFFLLFPERIESARLTPALRSLVKRTPLNRDFPMTRSQPAGLSLHEWRKLRRQRARRSSRKD
ncbi:ABC-three component system middle component 5 [Sphingomonas daechungensis]|uniref:ABC-three component system middle component 5 n=1 Tax=Sphingomonas daechungensis TaxID=1176646 RepID=UPI0037D9F3B7